MSRILLVDDNQAYRSTLGDLLRLAGHIVVEPSNSIAALRALKEEIFDVVITDIVMPEVDGLEVMRAVRAAMPRCPIIAISGGSPKLPAALGLRFAEGCGADVVLFKPFPIKAMLATIERVAMPGP